MIHPRALYLLFFTEMWERFSYYGMRALLTIYLISDVSKNGLGWSSQAAGQLYGIYTGLVYVTPLLGGYLADRYFGRRNAILMGALIMAMGHGSLALHGIHFFYTGLILLMLGNGLFKPNISSMVGLLYSPEQAHLKDGAYTIFYMGINLGALLGTLTCGYLGERVGWHYGFGAAGIGMVIGLVLFYINQNILGNIGLRQDSITKVDNTFANLTPVEVDRIWVIGTLSFFSIIFWLTFEQAGSSISIFALKYTDRLIYDFEVPASWFQSLNPLFIFIFAPIFSWMWTYLAKHNIYISNPAKFSMALFILAMGFVVLCIGAVAIPQGASAFGVSMLWVVCAIWLHTLGELCLSPVGLSAVNKLSPPHMLGLMFGVWFFASAIGNYLGGAIGGYIDVLAKSYTISSFFLIFVLISLLFSLIAALSAKKLQKLMHEIR
ncbi:MAG: peptide MFS transporter [Cytophagales bacterium]|nr:peptide MFS transporter [Cytophagales bacterium]